MMEYWNAVDWLRKHMIPDTFRKNVVDVRVHQRPQVNIMVGAADRQVNKVSLQREPSLPSKSRFVGSSGPTLK